MIKTIFATVFHNWISLTLVVLFLLRLALGTWQLGSLPPALNRDEAALGYNALLLWQSGQDEWQRPWPLMLESFGDYKLPGYVWAIIPMFILGGVSELSVRLPAAIAGVLLIPLTYGLVTMLFKNKTQAVAAAVLVATTPVWLFYSRMAFEAMVGLSLFLASIFCWLQAIESGKRLSKGSLKTGHSTQPWGLTWSWTLGWTVMAGILTTAAVLTYNTPLLLLPFLGLSLAGWSGWSNWKAWGGPVVFLGCLFLGMSVLFLPLTAQKKAITLFSDTTVHSQWLEYRQQLSPVKQKIWGNKYYFVTQKVGRNLVASLGIEFLVTKGGTHPWHQLPGFGHFTAVSFVLGWVGTLSLVISSMKKRGKDTFTSKNLLWWLLFTAFGLLPAAITVDAPHATRSLVFFWWWGVWASYGVSQLHDLLRRLLVRASVAFGVTAVFLALHLYQFGVYSQQYFSTYSETSSRILQAGLNTALLDINTHFPTSPVAVLDPDGYSYILVAWYERLLPQDFFKTQVRQLPNHIGFRYGERVGRYHFIAQKDDRSGSEKVLLYWSGNSWVVQQFQ